MVTVLVNFIFKLSQALLAFLHPSLARFACKDRDRNGAIQKQHTGWPILICNMHSKHDESSHGDTERTIVTFIHGLQESVVLPTFLIGTW